MEKNDIKVGIGDLNVALPPDKIITLGLGSCVGIALYDSINKIAGLAHIMLPNSKGFTNQSNPLKFADKAIPTLIESMIKKGAKKNFLKAKIAGGASMFSFGDKSSIADIGNRNGLSVKEILSQMSIPILSEDLGGNSGRTMIIEASDGKVFIRTVGKGMKEL
ncbi:chemotaxis protein CheD [Clostridium cylindrosporum]|uniref:Probable chemoreceptor glutamine deamidase CheD n=1 Tax=Clostridium cylindrosporum DSM 605 TaxID=1121307 RepID=A0A0J8G1P7_CLOCY|nr:chemotaxis protein CheD [Clostridium cylindrosporum]KMT21676.1 putative chemoreceptor glutamine deamidase CheD [Clostridium cylindrosporum DSM 605]